MEFPGLGKHCCENTCKQLDFLPMKCDACDRIYCKDHIQYISHRCPESYKKDKQVPVCPLCDMPIPTMPGESPDIKVGQHIDSSCQSDPAKERRKVYTQKCSYKRCKQKEVVSVKCNRCKMNFCLKHRHEIDHDCQGFMATGRGISESGAAAVRRSQGETTRTVQPKSTVVSGVTSKPSPLQATQNAQSYMTDEEAMSRAIQLSLADSRNSTQTRPLTQQEQEDAMLARALAESERAAPTYMRNNSRTKNSCNVE